MLCKKTLLNTPEQKGILSSHLRTRTYHHVKDFMCHLFHPIETPHTDAKSGSCNLLVKKVKVTLTYMYMYTHTGSTMGDTLAVLNVEDWWTLQSTIKRLTISHKQKPLFALSKMLVQTMLISFNWRSTCTTNVRMTHNYNVPISVPDVPLATETNDLLVVLTAGGSLGATVVKKNSMR